MINDGFDISDLLGSIGGAPKGKAAEKKSALRGKSIDGVRYVRLEDVIKLLDVNGALPGTAASLKKQLRKP